MTERDDLPAPSTVRSRTPRRVIVASLVGTSLEWYDFFLYGTASALVFNKLFFPNFDPAVGTLLAFATYAVGFIARPLGGIVFGHFGDRVGRKQVLVVTLLIMLALSSPFLACTYPVPGVARRRFCWSRCGSSGARPRRRVGRRGAHVAGARRRRPPGSARAGRRSGCRSATCWQRASSPCSTSCSPSRRSSRGAGGWRSCCPARS
jgi:hypothetical protein